MTDLASIAVVGRLGRDAELKYLQDGTPALRFSIAVSRYEKGAGERNETTDWWDVDMIGKRAEAVAQYLTKGKQVAVQGAPALRKGKDREGAERIYPTIKAAEIQLLGGKDDTRAAHALPDGTSARREEAARARAEGVGSRPAKADDFTDDIPF